jgi:hypothetical protein
MSSVAQVLDQGFSFNYSWIVINSSRSKIISMLNREHSYWYSGEVRVSPERVNDFETPGVMRLASKMV